MKALQNKKRKYNNATGNYKIDIFINGAYHCSTDWAKNCKIAVYRFKCMNQDIKGKITAHYDYQ